MVFPGDTVEGKHLSTYANMWWQWTYTMPRDMSPVVDRTGEKCHVNQQGDVWFLAGGYGSSQIKRTCEIPEGKYIFFPVINMLYSFNGDIEVSCEEAKRWASLDNDELLTIEIELDSMVATNPAHSRIASEECFDLLGLVPEEYDAPRIFPSAADGFWIMLKPLTKGKHTLKFNAQYDREKGAFSKMAQDIEYDLIIK